MRMAITIVKGKSPQPYEAPVVIVGLFFTFTYVILKGPNKLSTLKNSYIFLPSYPPSDLLFLSFVMWGGYHPR